MLQQLVRRPFALQTLQLWPLPAPDKRDLLAEAGRPPAQISATLAGSEAVALPRVAAPTLIEISLD